jgi:hypothetical protein
MSTTSSQYYRGASTSHYTNFPANNHEHLYALAAASWHQEPDHAPYVGPPSAAFLHYSPGGADSASASSSAPLPWPPGYTRPDLQVWPQPGGNHTYASRSAIHYGAAEGSATVPRPAPEASRQYQPPQILNTRQELPPSPLCDTYRSTDRFHELRIASVCAQSGTAVQYACLATNVHQESPANVVDPPFSTHAPGSHPFPRPSHPRSGAAPHLNGSEQSVTWENECQIPSIEPQQYPDHTSNALVSGDLTANQTHQTHASATPWPIVNAEEVAAEPSSFHHVRDEDQQWDLVQAQSSHPLYSHHAQPQHSAGTSTLAPGTRRPSVRKRVAKVPSSFVERQEKLKVSKRKGPLKEKQREKTHTMRKTKRICVRCRFYKSGVSKARKDVETTADSYSAMRVILVRSATRSQATRDRSASLATENILRTQVLFVDVSIYIP